MAAAAPAASQTVIDEVEELDWDRPEAWAMKYYNSVSLLTGLGPPRARALERPVLESGAWVIGVRAFGQTGRVEGDFTCSEADASYPPGSPNNLYGCEAPSNDRLSLDHLGVALTGVVAVRATDLHFGAAATFMAGSFRSTPSPRASSITVCSSPTVGRGRSTGARRGTSAGAPRSPSSSSSARCLSSGLPRARRRPMPCSTFAAC
jgi:hypothetical protein